MFLIKVLAHQLKNGKIAKRGEIVGLNDLVGNIEELEKKGYIKRFGSQAKHTNKSTPQKKN